MAQSEQKATVGFVGMGRMGLPMAGHVRRAGFVTVIHDINAASATEAQAAGHLVASSLPELGECAEVTLVIVPADMDVLSVCLGPGGLLSHSKPGTVVVLCSSIQPETVMRVADQASASGVDILDVPLIKHAAYAQRGELTLLVGGDIAVLDRIRPVLQTFSAHIHHLGGLGSGQVGKTVNNMIIWANAVAAAEAIQFGSAYGIDAKALWRSMQDCSADSWVLRELPNFRPIWHAKDLANSSRMAVAAGVPTPFSNMVAVAIEAWAGDNIPNVLEGARPYVAPVLAPLDRRAKEEK